MKAPTLLKHVIPIISEQVPSLQVIDEDAGTNGSSGVVYSLETGSNLPFYVDSITGDIHVLFTLDSQHLDWEKTSSYILKASNALNRCLKSSR